METIKQMRGRHEREIKQLRDECPHDETEVLPYEWAVGHRDGFVRACKECGQILERIPDAVPTTCTISTPNDKYRVIYSEV